MNLKIGLAICGLLFTTACDTMVRDTSFAERSETVNLTGTIEALFPEDRLFKVRDGRTAVVFRAGPEVENYDQLKVGDRISLDYFESVAVGMADPADPGTALGDVVLATAPSGDRPALAVLGSGTLVVEFLSYDSLTNSAEIRLPDGTTERVSVQPEMRAFAAARSAGDRIAVAVDRAMAIKITPVN